ncbi:hypothetical protein LTR62_000143 [Meristemomyces frigidus]|uniref:Uncharacterized protein n=1 Tax=Meristemomyces frigidus TaxID=1508187 RepID=A0AAN7YNP6_9PEZI|nr:hypothetical protein LTR62_000143 [Meristemomyces frigidus]
MGQSYSTRRTASTGHTGKRSPSQEKHTSGNSTTPLAARAHELDTDRSTVTELDDKHTSYGGTTANRSRANTMSFGSTLANDTTLSLDVTELEGHADVSRPPPPPRLRHLSELIDPAELPIDAHVRSPSGNLLAPEQFLVHPERPLSIRERQEEIRDKIRSASRLGLRVDGPGEEVSPPPPAKKV